MDAAPLFLLLLLPPADTTGDMAAGIQSSLRRELGEVAVAVAPEPLVTPAMWRGEKAPMRARFVARIGWTTRHEARIELLATASSTSDARQTRVLSFAPQDQRLERGRAIGLVLAELLREAPGSAFALSPPGGVSAKAESTTSLRLAPGAYFVTQRVMSGNWAMGPELRNGFGLAQVLWLQASGWALFGSADKYAAIGLGLGVRWDALHTSDGQYALGIGLGGELFHESAEAGGEDGGNASKWNFAAVGSVAGRLALWRGLRLVAEFDMRAATGRVSLATGDDERRRTYSYARWRPGFAVGLELAL